jgi:hypothetical protein
MEVSIDSLKGPTTATKDLPKGAQVQARDWGSERLVMSVSMNTAAAVPVLRRSRIAEVVPAGLAEVPQRVYLVGLHGLV